MTDLVVDDAAVAVKQLHDAALEIPRLVEALRRAFPKTAVMPDWFKIAREAADKLEALHEWKQLYSGDVLSLNNELEMFREACEDKEKYIRELEATLEGILANLVAQVPWIVRKINAKQENTDETTTKGT